MNKVLLVLQREYMSRVKKKSFLLSTILVPLIFPLLIGGMIFLMIRDEQNKQDETVRFFDESGLFEFTDGDGYVFKRVDGDIDALTIDFSKSDDFGLLHIPKISLNETGGVVFYTHTSPGIDVIPSFERVLSRQVKEKKLTSMGLRQEQLDSLETYVDIDHFNISEAGKQQKSSQDTTFWTGYAMGFMIYMFLFIFGAQVMQGVIEEKSSKIVEVIVSTLKPFQMMLGKVLGVAAVGATQFVIWIVLISVLSTVILTVLGLSMDTAELQLIANSANSTEIQKNPEVIDFLTKVFEVNWVQISGLFLFYFIGGYLLYGALFAAVGSAVDTPADAQQFMFPIMIPIIGALMALFMFTFREPDGTVSVVLSMIPFTSPIVMMGRVGFGVENWWEIPLSMVLLITGFLFTLWLAGRIYRIGILMHGTKVNYRTLARWFMQK